MRASRRIAIAALSMLVIFGFLLGSPGGSASSLDVDGGTLQAHSLGGWTGEAPGVLALDVDIKPESLEPRSLGDHLTAFIASPPETSGLDIATIRLCLGVAPCGSSGVAASYAGWNQGGRTLRVTFARADVIALLGGVPAGNVVLTVSASLGAQVVAGSATVRLVHAV